MRRWDELGIITTQAGGFVIRDRAALELVGRS
jgi:hypothetical protein